MKPVVIAVIGLALLTVSWLAWTGRWRSWAGQVFGGGWITLAPGVGVLFIAFALHEALPSAGTRAIGGVALVAAGAGMIMHFFEPRWWGPRWYRERDLNRLDLRDPYTALLKAAATPSLGERSSKAVEARLETSPRLARWRVAWVPERRKAGAAPTRSPSPWRGS